jgi:glucosylceramidase
LGWTALSALSDADRATYFQALFGAQGLGMGWIRLPIGASDFALDAYSLADTPEDYAMQHFSIARDRLRLIPYIKAAQAVNPRLLVHASPWSPPGWMKVSGRMDGITDSRLRAEPRVMEAYALYLRKTVEAYRNEGIEIRRLMVQNELDSPAPFPGCVWSPELFVNFHLDYLRPVFSAGGLNTEIWAGTFRTISGLQAHDCFGNSAFRSYVTGAAFQYSFPAQIRDLLCLYPGTRWMHTESVCHNGDNSVDQAASQFDSVVGCLGADAELFTYWNLVLERGGASSWGWKQNSLFSVDSAAKQLITNPEYQVFKLIADALQPGALRVRSYSYLVPTVCFRNPNGGLVVLMRNLEGPRRVEFTVDGSMQTADLPGHSVCAVPLCVKENS